MTRSYFRGCHGAVIVFDLTSRQSLESVRKYVATFREECPQDACDNIILVGNKVDKEEARVIPKDEALELCSELKCIEYYETSAQNNINVDETFFSVAAAAFHKENKNF